MGKPGNCVSFRKSIASQEGETPDRPTTTQVMSEENGEDSANDTTRTTAHQEQYSLRNSRPSDDTGMSEENGETSANDMTTTMTTAHQEQYSLRNSRPSNDDTSISEGNGEVSANDTTTTTAHQEQYFLRNSGPSNDDTSMSEKNGEASANDTLMMMMMMMMTGHIEQYSLQLSLFDFFAPLECLFLLLSLGEDFFAIVNTAESSDDRFVVFLFYIFGIVGGVIDLIDDDQHRLVKVVAASLFEVVQFVLFSFTSGWDKMPVIVFACLAAVQNGIIVANAIILVNSGDEQGEGKKKSSSLKALLDRLDIGYSYKLSLLTSVVKFNICSIMGNFFVVILVSTYREDSPFRSAVFDFIVTFFLWLNPVIYKCEAVFDVLRLTDADTKPLLLKMANILCCLYLVALPTMVFWWHRNSPKPEPKNEFVLFIIYCVTSPLFYLIATLGFYVHVRSLIRSPFAKPIIFTITGSRDGNSQPNENV